MRWKKLKGWINMITILHEKALNESMIDKWIDEFEGQELKKDIESLCWQT